MKSILAVFFLLVLSPNAIAVSITDVSCRGYKSGLEPIRLPVQLTEGGAPTGKTDYEGDKMAVGFNTPYIITIGTDRYKVSVLELDINGFTSTTSSVEPGHYVLATPNGLRIECQVAWSPKNKR